ncbi:hypothetical protein IFO69_00305 [Echinicola sp. CAU 1574]|uniref:Transmembrane protein n=1 Tax=Echinicola arenosa TaxID=2774144 RepID=A0ABR9AGW5_9BACT|nr:hypothetical protein [Echinicola arenosa]MBD8487175.1 hypothetical protein [Echinicola arenosa]
MNHPFYQKPIKEQKRFIILAGMIIFSVFGLIISLAVLTKFYWLSLIAAFWLIISAPFVDTPTGKKSGKLHYYSPLFISEKLSNNKVIFHGGTLFDYYFVLDFSQSGRRRTHFIIHNYLEGILAFIEKHESDFADDTVLEGTSYILHAKTAQKLGFSPAQTDGIQTIILLLNYPTLTLSYSISKGRLSFPKLSRVKTYQSTLGKLKSQKEKIKFLKDKLKP